jgi:CubicO group peptidase (beta-lactamase class C family)
MRKVILLLIIPAFFFFKSQGQTTAQTGLASFIKHKGDSLLKAEKVPGIFVGVLDGSRRQYFSFGYANTAQKIPFDSNTIFEAGSITKIFTAYILESVLAEKGLSDSQSIFPYLPDSVKSNKTLAAITFLSLLNHTSGLPRLPDNLPLVDPAPYDTYTASHLFSYLKSCRPRPDGKSNYSNLGAGLAGVLAERVSGTPYKTLLKRYMLSPFRMNDAMQAGAKRATGYFEKEPHPFWQMNVLYPAGGLQCSAGDMLQYLETMSRPQAKTSRQTTLIAKLLQPTVAISPAVSVCRAWHTLQQKGKPTIYWHNGGTYGFSTFAAFEKDQGKAVIVVVNQFNKNGVSDMLGVTIIKKLLE